MAHLASRVLDDDIARSLLADNVVNDLAQPDRHAEFGRWGGQLGWVQAVSVFADWRERYAARLTPERSPWS